MDTIIGQEEGSRRIEVAVPENAEHLALVVECVRTHSESASGLKLNKSNAMKLRGTVGDCGQVHMPHMRSVGIYTPSTGASRVASKVVVCQATKLAISAHPTKTSGF